MTQSNASGGKSPGKEKKSVEIEVTALKYGSMDFRLISRSPFIYNSIPEKARHELLAPSGRKNAAEKASTLKHNPLAEYRNSVYQTTSDDGPTRLEVPGSMFKGAIRTAALDMPGVSKSAIGRLLSIPIHLHRVSMYGIPKLFMTHVRSADLARTPDIRTRAILPEWCCELSISFVTPLLRAKTVTDLLESAGIVSGIGDWRQEKGSGDYGRFEIVDSAEKDAVWERIASYGTREAQDAALEHPEYYDYDTQRMMEWFIEEIPRRGRENDLLPKVVAADAVTKAKAAVGRRARAN
jgi:hypothetical protein